MSLYIYIYLYVIISIMFMHHPIFFIWNEGGSPRLSSGVETGDLPLTVGI